MKAVLHQQIALKRKKKMLFWISFIVDYSLDYFLS